jgi:hypothetical protein
LHPPRPRWFTHRFVPGPGYGLVCPVLSSRARACRRDRQVPRVSLPKVSLRLDVYRLLRRSCTLMGVFVISPCLPFCWSRCLAAGLRCSTAITPPRSYCVLLRHPFAFHRFPGFASYTASLLPLSFMAGRGGLLQLLDMSLLPCCSYHPAEVTCRLGQPATCHAAFARNQGARPSDL